MNWEVTLFLMGGETEVLHLQGTRADMEAFEENIVWDRSDIFALAFRKEA